MHTRLIVILLLPVLAYACGTRASDMAAAEKTAETGVPDTVLLQVPEIYLSLTEKGLIREGGLMHFQKQPYSGYLEVYYDNDTLMERAGYVDGMREGVALKYYPDGTLKEERDYRRNKKHGNHKGWWPGGTDKFDYHFVEGVAEGTHRTWYQNGHPFQLFTYKQGKEYGPQKLWKPDGSVRGNYVVKNGHRYGLIGLKNCKSVKYDDDEYEALAY